MANRHRGCVDVELGGQTYTLALGLGALAELESAMGVDWFGDALALGGATSAKKMHTFMLALLKGNGVAVTDAVAAAVSNLTVPGFLELVGAVLKASGLRDEEAKGDTADPLAEPQAPSAGAAG